ncbi:alpha/beta fold hydrolase [Mesorhizobium sp. BR1-1-16]|uniref:alpha/beta hydrolase family protein n=1 Tax=Mesorhizobium sp. BR1-1-16 TaxID=2876653 RepID=UPI001CCE8634|nr:alpha/beta fold hydrolase [Mesorhizobium sp. BR1-1-16]MBZ9937134.1 alpha/beta fold hydrolase [Mesorhizobium sp. BR1-1-16]
MGLLFEDHLHDEFASWLLAYIPYGGPDFGEIAAIGRDVGHGDDTAFHAAFLKAAERNITEGEAAERAGRAESARELYLRASAFLAASYHPLYGAPTDPRLLATWRRQIEIMERAFALSDPWPQRLEVPFEGVAMPAWFVPAAAHADAVRPLVIFTNGYDATVTDMLFASAVAASRRGYHSLIFDGPGQGGMLYEHGLPLRADWETVIGAVVDAMVDHPLVDPARIVLNGWSLGGYLAPRAAAGEPRLAALIADPFLPSLATGIRAMAMKFGATAEEASDLGHMNPAIIAAMESVIAADPGLTWKIRKRAFWVHGVATLADYLKVSEAFTVEDRLHAIRCPTLITVAEEDGLAKGGPAACEALTCPKTLIRFSSAEGAGGHCEMGNRSLLNRRTFDWLDDVFAGKVG